MGSKITAAGDWNHEIKRCLLFGRKAMTNLDNILKSRDITWPTKVRLDKAIVFPVVMYGLWELDYKESQMSNNWCFWTLVLEKTLENPLDCKEIQPLTLLQQIFPTQELNQGLLHCRRILYQLRSQGSPIPFIIRKMKIRTTMIYHFPVTRIADLTFIIIIIDIRPVLARLWRNWNPHIGMCNDAGTVGSLTV